MRTMNSNLTNHKGQPYGCPLKVKIDFTDRMVEVVLSKES